MNASGRDRQLLKLLVLVVRVVNRREEVLLRLGVVAVHAQL